MWKHYYSVTSINEALRLLAEHTGHARIIAGGTDILIELERGQRPGIDTLIDLSRVSGLDTITLDGDAIRLGALVTHNQAVASELIQQRALPLAQACWEVGAPQIRNRATIAGNVITGSPANDTITPLIALGASVTLTSLAGERTIALADFYRGVRRIIMRPDELLTAIRFPALAEHERGMFLKLGLRRAQAISVVNVAVVLGFGPHPKSLSQVERDLPFLPSPSGEGPGVMAIVTRARIALGCVAPTIVHATEAEESLVGQTLTADAIAQAGRLAASAVKPIDDVRSSAEYRVEMTNVLVKRALRMLAAGDERKNWPDAPPLLWGDQGGRRTLADSIQHDATVTIQTIINGQPYTLQSGQDKTLLRLLREDAELPGTKEGCAEGECGACTVYLDGAAVMACMVAAPRAHNAEIVTIEGLAHNGELHPVQRAFVEAGAVQCGYCTPGFLMAGAKLLEECPNPTREQAMQSITGNLCRCTGYYKIIEALQNAAHDRARETAP
ncbi:MAG: FAD binding domain-containing protein [Aggregatilineales bacterium]